MQINSHVKLVDRASMDKTLRQSKVGHNVCISRDRREDAVNKECTKENSSKTKKLSERIRETMIVHRGACQRQRVRVKYLALDNSCGKYDSAS